MEQNRFDEQLVVKVRKQILRIWPLVIGFLTLGGLVFGFFQWGHTIGEAKLSLLEVLHEQKLESLRQSSNQEKKALESTLLSLNVKLAGQEDREILLRERIANRDETIILLEKELLKLGASADDLFSLNNELVNMNRGLVVAVEQQRPYFEIEVTTKGSEIEFRPKNISNVSGRIIRTVVSSWIDGQQGNPKDEELISIQHPGENSFASISSATGSIGPKVVSGEIDFRAVSCIVYESLNERDYRRWQSEFWAVYHNESRKVRVLKENTILIGPKGSACDLTDLIPKRWIEDAVVIKDSIIKPKLEEVRKLRESNDFSQAIVKIKELAAQYSVKDIESFHWKALCWSGALGGHAKEVIFACTNAFESASEMDSIHRLDSRAIARAIAKDFVGAKVDLEAVLKQADGREDFEQYIPLRMQILEGLNQGIDPMTEPILTALKME